MLNAVFRGGQVWGAFHSAHTWAAGQQTVVAIRWFQVDPVAGTVIQQGAFGLPAYFYFYPALMVDSNGNMIMVFSRSSGGGSGVVSEFPSIRQTGRKSTDQLGKLQEPSTLIKRAWINYVNLDTSGQNRWGDYAGVASGTRPTHSGLVLQPLPGVGNTGHTIGAAILSEFRRQK